MVAVTPETSPIGELERFVDEAGVALRRALVARYGIDVGRDAAADALAWAVEHWPDLSAMANPVGYLYRARERHVWSASPPRRRRAPGHRRAHHNVARRRRPPGSLEAGVTEL